MKSHGLHGAQINIQDHRITIIARIQKNGALLTVKTGEDDRVSMQNHPGQHQLLVLSSSNQAFHVTHTIVHIQ